MNQIAKIKKIVLPESIVEISRSCFMGLQDGKSINIPKGLRKKVEYICSDVKWDKYRVSKKMIRLLFQKEQNKSIKKLRKNPTFR